MLREKLYHRVLKVDPNFILNSDIPTDSSILYQDQLAAVIKNAMNRFKALAMDEAGQQVDYARLAQSPEYQEFCVLVGHLHHFDIESLKTPNEETAFWINLYNAMVVDAVIQFNVEQRVTEGWLGILAFFERAAYQVGSYRFSLTNIEHGILRGNRGFPYFPGTHFAANDPRKSVVVENIDPRIHFALNCASQSCPPIGVYSADRIDTQLELATRNFIGNNIQVDESKNQLSLSAIFKWYGVDFGGKSGIIDFVIQYLSSGDRKIWLEKYRHSVRLKYQPYDWGLNG